MIKSINILSLLLALCFHIALSQIALPPGYDASRHPNYGLGIPTKVDMATLLVKVHTVNEILGLASIDAYINFQWEDRRILGPNFTLTEPLTENPPKTSIWLPDYDVRNSNGLAIGQSALVIFPNGTLQLLTKTSIAFTLDFDYVDYPFDSQHMAFIVEPFISTKDELVFGTTEIHRSFTRFENVTDFFPYVSSRDTQFIFDKYTFISEVVDGFSRVTYRWAIKRISVFMLLNQILPLAILIVVGFSTFFIEPEKVTLISLNSSGVIAVMSLFIVIYLTIPPIHYFTRLMFFLFWSFIVTFISLIFGLFSHSTARKCKTSKINDDSDESSREIVSIADEKVEDIVDQRKIFYSFFSSTYKLNNAEKKKLRKYLDTLITIYKVGGVLTYIGVVIFTFAIPVKK